MQLLDYYRLEIIRHGSLILRRWEKRWVLLFVSVNIWVDQLVSGFLNQGKETLIVASEGVEAVRGYKTEMLGRVWDIGQALDEVFDLKQVSEEIIQTTRLIDIIILVLLLISIFFWLKILTSLVFVYADYQCAKLDGDRRQYFIVFAILFNIGIYYLLKAGVQI